MGNSWVAGIDSWEQRSYREHADYLNNVHTNNRILIGGPLWDYSEIQIAIEATSACEVEAILADDPWLKQDMLRIERVTKWVLLIDPRTG